MEYKIELDSPDILVVTNLLTETGVKATRRLKRVPDCGLHSDKQRRHSVL